MIRSLALVGMLLLSFPASASAECGPGQESFPSFISVAPNAPGLVMGEVVDVFDAAGGSPGDPSWSLFRVRVDQVLRGPDMATLDIRRAIEFAPCLGPLRVRAGNRLALALGAPVADGQPEVLAVAFVQPAAHVPAMLPAGVEVLTPLQVTALAERPASPGLLVMVAGVLFLAFWLTLAPRRRSRDPWEAPVEGADEPR